MEPGLQLCPRVSPALSTLYRDMEAQLQHMEARLHVPEVPSRLSPEMRALDMASVLHYSRASGTQSSGTDSKAEQVKQGLGKFTFSVPDGHPQAGEKMEKPFEYSIVETADEASKVIAEKNWNVVSMVNDTLKANARSNAYQAALLPYRPSEVSAADIQERMVRDFIRLGVPEAAARAQVAALTANAGKVAETVTDTTEPATV